MKRFLCSLVFLCLVTSLSISVIASDTLRIGTPYSIETLDPLKYSSDGDFYILSQIYEPLVSIEGSNVTPRLAESWENTDATTWIFHLREGMTWHDGNDVFPTGTSVEVTAEDVKYTYDLFLDSTNGARQQPKLASVIRSVDIVDASTIKFVTFEPYAFLLEDLNRVPILSRDVVETLGLDSIGDFPIGCGPFKFVEYLVDDHVTLERNESFFITPQLAQVIFFVIPDKSSLLMALEADDIDIALQIPSTEVSRVLDDGDLVVVPNSYAWYRYAAFNMTHPFFLDWRVRMAISMAVDMDWIVTNIFPEPQIAKRAYVPVPEGFLGFDADASDLWMFDLTSAVEMLRQAGWEDTNGDGTLDKDGENFQFTIKTPNDPSRQKLAVHISTALKRIGIDVEVQVHDWATIMDDIRVGDTEMFILGGGSTVDGLFNMFHSRDARGDVHDTKYSNAAFDKALDTARATVDPVLREEILKQAARILVLDRVHLCAYNEFVQVAMNPRVTGFSEIPTPWTSLVNVVRHVQLSN